MAATNEETKKRNSFGSVYYRADRGKWDVRIPTGEKTSSGRTQYRHHYARTKREAEKLLRELRKAKETSGLVVRPARAVAEELVEIRLTVLEAIDAFIETKKAEGKSDKTLEQYNANRKRFAAHSIAKKAAEDLSAADVEAYMAWRRENVWSTQHGKGSLPGKDVKVVKKEGASASNATINRDLALLSGAMSRLTRLGEISDNPVLRVKKPKEAKGARVALSKEETARLVDACDDHLRPLVLAAIFTGARKGELTSLNWGDVSLDSHTLMIRRTKTGNATRLRLHPVLAAELEQLRKKTGGEKGIPSQDAPVFLSTRGTRFVDVRKAWRTAVKRAELVDKKGLSFHSLRHTFAVHFLEHGAAVTDLQAILGHSNLATTQVYAKMVDARMNASIEALDFGLGEGAGAQIRNIERSHERSQGVVDGETAAEMQQAESA